MMKISELKDVLDAVALDHGDPEIGLKVIIDHTIHIVEITGVSLSGFEGLNITNEEE